MDISVIKDDDDDLLYLSFIDKFLIPISVEKVDIFDYKFARHYEVSSTVKVTFVYTTKKDIVTTVILINTNNSKISKKRKENRIKLNNTKIFKIRIIGELLFLIDFDFKLFWIIKEETSGPFLQILKKFQIINKDNASCIKTKPKMNKLQPKSICQLLSYDCVDILVLLKKKKIVFLILKHTQTILHKFKFFPKTNNQNTALYDAADLMGDNPCIINSDYFNFFNLPNVLIGNKNENLHCNHTSDVLDTKKIEEKTITNLFSHNICIPPQFYNQIIEKEVNSFDGFFLLLGNNTKMYWATLYKRNIKISKIPSMYYKCYTSSLNHNQNNLKYLNNGLDSFIFNSKIKEFTYIFLLCIKRVIKKYIHVLCLELIFSKIEFNEMYEAIFIKSDKKKIENSKKKRRIERSKHNQRKKRKTKKIKKNQSSKQMSMSIILNFDLLKKKN